MNLSIEAQRFEQAKALRFLVATIQLVRFALVEQLTAYTPSRGLGDNLQAHLNCRRKLKCTTRADAERVRDKLQKKDDSPVRVYGCTYCGGFHLTSQGVHGVAR